MKYLYQLIALVFLAIIISFGVSYYFTPKVVYVRIGEVVNKYEGMLEAKNSYKEKMSTWQSNLDTLELDYQKMVSEFNMKASRMSTAQRAEEAMTLDKQKKNIQNYIGTLEQKAQAEDEKMTQGVINQINAAIEEYGKNKGYDYVLGTTNDGNILYGVKSNDITEDVLVYLNAQYKKK